MDDFSRYLYLPRLRDPGVLARAVAYGLGLLSWDRETFAIAEGVDANTGRFLGLRAGEAHPSLREDSDVLLVHPDAARRQLEAERLSVVSTSLPGSPPAAGSADYRTLQEGAGAACIVGELPRLRCFHASADLNPLRAASDAGRIAEEVLAHLVGLAGAQVRVSLEIEAIIPGGAPDHVVRTVTENIRTLKFSSYGFERE